MKNSISVFILVILLFNVSGTSGQGLENFNNFAGASGTYADGTFIGQDGSTWTFTQCRGDRAINAPTPCLGKNRTPAANVFSGSIHNGCGVISFDFKQGFSTAVDLNLLINGLVVKNVTSPGGPGDTMNIHNSGPVTVNVSGEFEIRFEQNNNATSGQVSIDNVTWTAYGAGPLPEPANYPTNFSATPSPFTIILSWVDATGDQLPTVYLIRGSSTNNIELPVDGVPVPDDPDLADGSGALNILPGVQTCQFANLPGNSPFYFKIFPYTNSGSTINFKTDGIPPGANATTPNVAIINSENFNSGNFGTWAPLRVSGDTSWTIDMTHGVGGTPCAKASGYYGGGPHVTEMWLHSPAMNFNQYSGETMSFQTAKNYAGPTLEVLISSNYDGTGNPNNFTWTPLTATLSAGGWAWTSSGNIDISAISGTNVYVAFKFTSSDIESATWEVDDIRIIGVSSLGIPETVMNNGFSLVPNPSDGHFRILFKDNSIKEIRIVSVIGTELFHTVTGQSEIGINLPELPSGIYFIQVKKAGANQPEVKKLIIR